MRTPAGLPLRLAVSLALLWATGARGELLFPSQGTPPGGLDGGAPFSDPAVTCVTCHAQSAIHNRGFYLPYDTWTGTMMANSVRDPLFLAALSVAEQDTPNMGQWCIRCHTPAAYVRGDSLPGDGSALDALDTEGVACEVCHRSMVDAGDPNAPYEWNAQLFFDLTQTEHGPYVSSANSFHACARDAFTASSALCGQCHEVKNPLSDWIDASGNDTGLPFPLDTTYDEWLGSSYSSGATPKQCQDCHMPTFTGNVPVAKNGPGRTDPPTHVFVGGNAWGVEAVFFARTDGGILDGGSVDAGLYDGGLTDPFWGVQQAALANLTLAASLQVTGPAAVSPGASFPLEVVVTNLSGHKLPTGYADGRRVFQQVSWVDSTGAETVLIGLYDAGGATLVADPQLRVYEAIQGSADGGLDDHLLHHQTVLKDTRIPPSGFQALPTTVPVGTTWFGDGDGGYHSFDDGTYTLTAPATLGAASLIVRLFYQPTTADYVGFLAGADTSDARGTTLQQIWNATGQAAPALMAEATVQLQVTAADAGASADAGATPDAGGASGGTSHGCGCGTGEAPLAVLLLLSARRRRTANPARSPSATRGPAGPLSHPTPSC
jgi:hypothetical protein